MEFNRRVADAVDCCVVEFLKGCVAFAESFKITGGGMNNNLDTGHIIDTADNDVELESGRVIERQQEMVV